MASEHLYRVFATTLLFMIPLLLLFTIPPILLHCDSSYLFALTMIHKQCVYVCVCICEYLCVFVYARVCHFTGITIKQAADISGWLCCYMKVRV